MNNLSMTHFPSSNNFPCSSNLNNEGKTRYTKSSTKPESSTETPIKQRGILAKKSEDAYFYPCATDISEASKAVIHTHAPELLRNTITYQPDLADSPAKEAALFREMLRPYINLPEKQRQKAVLKLIQDRIATKISYSYDIDTEGVKDYDSSVEEILADDGEGIDCEDYTNLTKFYFDIAQEEKLLPESAQMVKIIVPGHQFAVYISPSYEDSGKEYYVIDTYTTTYVGSWLDGWLEDKKILINPGEKLYTLKEYNDVLKKEFVSFRKNIYDKYYPVEITLSPFEKGRRVYGRKIFDADLLTDVDRGTNTIDESVSSLDVTEIQHKYLIKYGRPKLPSDYNQAEFEDYVNAIKIKDALGYYKKFNKPDTVISGKDFNITAGQARYLIGNESQTLNRKLTIADLDLDEQQKIELLGEYSPILNRKFTHDDLNLDPNIEYPADTNSISPAVTPLSQTTDSGSSNFADILEFKYHLRLKELITPASLVIDLFSGIAEFAIIDAIASKRYNKVKERNRQFFDPRKTIEILQRTSYQEKIDMRFLYIIQNIFVLLNDIKDPAENTCNNEIDNGHTKNLQIILEKDGKSIFLEDIKKICIAIIALLQLSKWNKKKLASKHTEKINKIEVLYGALSLIAEQKIASVKISKEIANIFKPYGITLKYSTSRFLGKHLKYKNITAQNHKLKINIRKFYLFLRESKLLLPKKYLFELIKQNLIDLIVLYKINKLDKRKIRYHKIDKKLKMVAVSGSLVPIIPINDITKSYMYYRGKKYRKKNQQIINTRITEALTFIDSSTLTFDEKSNVKDKLTTVNSIKQDHLQIKINQNEANCYIHGISASAFLASILFGPIGAAIKVGIKSSSKITTSIAGTVYRHKIDNNYKKADNFITTKDIYLYLKELYISAKEANNEEVANIIAELVNICFNIDQEVFDLLVATEVIENDIYKLSFSQKYNL